MSRFSIGQRVEFNSRGNPRLVFRGEVRQLLQRGLVSVVHDGETKQRIVDESRLRRTGILPTHCTGGQIA